MWELCYADCHLACLLTVRCTLQAAALPYQDLSAAPKVQVLLDQRGKYTQLQIPESCAEQLRSQGVTQLRVTNHLRHLDYSVYDGAPDHCTYFNGTWLMLSHGAGEAQVLPVVCLQFHHAGPSAVVAPI